jgi:23S rRNA pseudouridine1911/1915/1917 synthase
MPQNLPVSLLYEDEDIAVIDKAAGMVVHPAAGNWEGTLVNALLFRLKGLTGVGGEARPGLVHRLDKGTSGCMVIAKHDRALKALQAAFKARQVTKLYLAMVHGQPPEQGALRTPFGRHPVNRKRFTGRIKSGKLAVTEFVVRERLVDAALLEVLLKTGRTHQIRVHLSELGHPLLGDPVYGGLRRGTEKVRAVQKELGRPALHAWRLQFLHPCTEIPVQFEAPIPDDFKRARNQLR